MKWWNMQQREAVLPWGTELRCEGSVRVLVSNGNIELVGLPVEHVWVRNLGTKYGVQNGWLGWEW